MTDQQFLQQMEAGTLAPEGFDHAGHVRLAWIYLQRGGRQEAEQRTCDTIRRYAAALGAAAKFHCTVTVALVRLMAAGGAADRDMPWPAFLVRNAALLADARAALARHYSPTLLGSDAARAAFVEPDRAPLP